MAEVSLGALHLYAKAADEFDAASQWAAAVFAEQIGVATAKVTCFAESHDLALRRKQAMKSRATTEQAKGILIATQLLAT
jgi:hypothetical protein